MDRVELSIYKAGTQGEHRAVVNKWKFYDSMMGEQYLVFTITSEHLIGWQIGDYCVFRGETYTLNYKPSVTQKARTGERQDAYTYENVKFESYQEELTRCLMLDITPTNEAYIAALGTNYTGSSKFQLFCGETSINGSVLTPVCTLALKMQANLDRMFGTNTWKVLVDTTTTYTDISGKPVLVTHTEDKVLSFDNTTIAQALAEVHNTFDLDFCVKGRNIYIGYNLKNLTSDNVNETFSFGYGKGYPTHEDPNKGLFQIKKIANSQQKIVTRLRVLGSTKNLPYRYYNKRYDLSQALFPINLQLPDTFIEEGLPTDEVGANTKWGHNKQRSVYLRAVKGDTNDAYIDKNDDAANCIEGIREDSVRFDGSNSDLPEIYPTIEEATYEELRNAGVADQDGNTELSGASTDSHGKHSFLEYEDSERIDELLAIGYQSEGIQVDDANKGDGILEESGSTDLGITREAVLPLTSLSFSANDHSAFFYRNGYYSGEIKTLLTIQDVFPGNYALIPTGPSYDSILYSFNITCQREGIAADIGYIITINQISKETGDSTILAMYISDVVNRTSRNGIYEMPLPELPDVKENQNAKVQKIVVTEFSDIVVTFTPTIKNVQMPSGFADPFYFVYQVGTSRTTESIYQPEYTWKSLDDNSSMSDTFHVFIKDMGFDIAACFTGETPTIAMKSGMCVGREFEIGENVQKVTYNGKKGYMLALKRVTDSSLNTYYPSATNPIAAGDNYVLLNINMPDVYIRMAEVRLLRAATDYLADNSTTQYTYQPYIDDIYLQRNWDNMKKEGRETDCVFWRLYAGLKFTFLGIPEEEDGFSSVDLTIEKLTISMGEGLTPKVEITLNDDVQQGILQKITTSIDRIYNGSLFSGGIGGGTTTNLAMLLSLLQSEGEKMFLSRRHADTASGRITFEKGLKSEGDAEFGNFIQDASGAGIWQDDQGNWHVEGDYLHARKRLTAKEVQIEDVHHVGGQQLLTAASMECAFVVEYDDFWRCFFLREGTDGKKVENKWAVGDQAYVNTFNLERQADGTLGNHRLWRLVTGTSLTTEDVGTYMIDGEMLDASNYHFIDLSKDICEAGSSAPLAGDNIVQLGNQNGDADRENAIIIAGAGSASPYIRQFTKIVTFHLPEPETQLKPGDNILTGILNILPGSKLPDGGDVGDVINMLTGGQKILRRDLEALDTGNYNLLLNTGFTGDYQSDDAEDNTKVESETQIYSPNLKYWQHESTKVVQDEESASGYAAVINDGVLRQKVTEMLVLGDSYCVAFKGKGEQVTLLVGGCKETLTLDDGYSRKVIKLICTDVTDDVFTLEGVCTIAEIQLTKGNVPNVDWLPSPNDNNKVLANMQNLSYLTNAILNASTSVLGGLILTQMIRVGNYRDQNMSKETGGMSGIYTSERSPFVWGGGTMEQAFYTINKYARDPSYQASDEEITNMAKFVVTHGGRAILNDIVLRGYIYALGGKFRGTVEATDGVFNGEVNATSGIFQNVRSLNGNFEIDKNGNFSCSNANIKGSIYTPMFIINADNWFDNIQRVPVVHPTSPFDIDRERIKIKQTGLNVQLDFSVNPYFYLPTEEDYLGARANIVNNLSTLEIVKIWCIYAERDSEGYEQRTTGWYSLRNKGFATFFCIKDSDTIKWMLISDSTKIIQTR